MPAPRRTRRPLVALIVLLLILLVGYAIQASRHGATSPGSAPAPAPAVNRMVHR